MEGNKQYKRVPFTIELDKKIQSGEIKGRIVTKNGECFNKLYGLTIDGKTVLEEDFNFRTNSRFWIEHRVQNLLIELPEETPITFHVDIPKGHAKIHGDAISFVNEEIPKLDDITTREGFCRTFQKHEFKPFDKVLVRNHADENWKPDMFWCETIRYKEDAYKTMDGWVYKQCIPYEGNEYLLGTNNNPK